MASQNIDKHNVRLSIELSGIYNKLLQVIVLLDEPSTDIKTSLMAIAEDLQETLGEMNLYQSEPEGEINNV